MTHDFDINSSERHFVAHGGGMLSVCATVGALLALRAVGIGPTSFTTLIGWSAGHFVVALVAAGYTLEEIVSILIKGSFVKMFPKVHNLATIVAPCLVRSRLWGRHYALGTALYDCTGLEDFWKEHNINGFPEKLCVISVNELGETFAFTGQGSFVHAHDGSYARLGGPPTDIVPISQATGTIPAVFSARTCQYVVGRALGNEAVQKLSCPSSYMLDGGLARKPLDLLGQHYQINRKAVITCWAGGPGASRDLRRYRLYTALALGAMANLTLSEQLDREVGLLLEPPGNLGALDFGASSELKLRSVFDAMNGSLQQLSQYMDVPPQSAIREEQNQISGILGCQPMAACAKRRDIVQAGHQSIEFCGRHWGELKHGAACWLAGSTTLDLVECHNGQAPLVNDQVMKTGKNVSDLEGLFQFLNSHPDAMAEFQGLLKSAS